MTERYVINNNCEIENTSNHMTWDSFTEVLTILNGQSRHLEELGEENEQLKQQLMDCKKDEKELSISFMEYKMQLIDVLQQNYNYAYNQRQKNLDKSIVARTYELLYQTIDNIAEAMNVDIERFPKR